MNLLFHQAALGDFVLTFPLLRAMSEPTVVVGPWGKASLAARMFGHVQPRDIEMWEFTRLHSVGGPTSVSPAVGDLFAEAERIISFISRPGEVWADNVARLAPAAAMAHVQPRPPATWTRHICAWHRQQLTEQGLMWPKEGDPAGLQGSPWGLGDGPVVVHPGSGGPEKCWPVQRFEAVIEALRTAGREVVAVLGEAEAERWPDETLARWRTQYAARLLRSLDELHEVLSGAAGYIGNDSGPTHLAAQMGLATVALFGPSDPRVWSPIGPHVTILAPPTPRAMEWLSVEAVVAACG